MEPDADPAAPVSTAAPVAARSNNPAPRGRVVVANRGSGTITVIDAHSGAVAATIQLPGPSPEPMYVVDVPAMNRVFVGDRANDRVVAFDSRTFEVEGTVPTAPGIWHMWVDPQSRQLWVVNDVADAVTVIDPKRLSVIVTVPMPADLTEGCGPHDTIVDPTTPHAYVTITCTGGVDHGVKYSSATFRELDRAEVGEDPHLSLARQNGWLYVPSQGSGVVTVLDRATLDPVAQLVVPGAHGAGMLRNGSVFYTTNLPGGGTDALVAIDTRSNTIIGSVDAPETVPHNVALSPDGSQMYLTHSGATNAVVTVYTTSRQNPVPQYVATIPVGLNPFGLAWVH
jgi:YVTN family beta-propeller protein